MTQKIIMAGAVTDWLGAAASGLPPDMAAQAANIQQLFDAIDDDPRNQSRAEAILAGIGHNPAKGSIGERAAREILRRYDEEFIPEIRRTQMSALAQSDIKSLERIRNMLASGFRGVGANDAQPPAPGTAENNLRLNNIPYRTRAGQVIVVGDVDFSDRDMLPDLAGVVVTGGYYIFNVPMKNMHGTPKYVGGNFFCGGNGLETLEGATQEIGGGFNCKDNDLKDLRHGPQKVGGDYIVENNRLESLKGAPENLPNGIFNVLKNPRIRDFEHAPQTFRELQSDHGLFPDWPSVPSHLLQSQERILRLAVEFRERVNAVAQEARGLTRPVSAPQVAHFRRGA